MQSRTLTTFAATLAAALIWPALATAGTYTDSDTKQFTEAAARTEFTFTNLPEAVGDVTVTVELSGPYGDTANVRAYASIAIDGTDQGNMCETGCGEGCVTGQTKTHTVDASTVADGQLTVAVDNSEGVHTRCDTNRIGVTVEYPTNDPPVADDTEVSVREDTPETIELVASDPNGDPLTWEYAALPTHGQLTGLPPEITYTPDTNYNGSDRFGFVVTDDHGASSEEATVAIVVDPVNDPPEWVRPERTSYEIRAEETFTLDVEATDVDDETLEYGVEPLPDHGTFTSETGTFEWTPSSAAIDDQIGDHTFTFTATDGEATITRDIDITVLPPPMADAGDTGGDTAGGDTGDTAEPDAASPDADAARPDTGGLADTRDRPTYGLRGGGCGVAGNRSPVGLGFVVLFLLCAWGIQRASCVVPTFADSRRAVFQL